MFLVDEGALYGYCLPAVVAGFNVSLATAAVAGLAAKEDIKAVKLTSSGDSGVIAWPQKLLIHIKGESHFRSLPCLQVINCTCPSASTGLLRLSRPRFIQTRPTPSSFLYIFIGWHVPLMCRSNITLGSHVHAIHRGSMYKQCVWVTST